MDSESLKPQEVADMLKITRNMVYVLIRRGELNGYRVGNKVRVDLNEVIHYKNRNRKASGDTGTLVVQAPILHEEECIVEQTSFIVCGQDMLLDVLAAFLEQNPNGTRATRSYVGSYTALCALYQGEVQMAAIHLWNGETGEYNIPYVRMLMPGVHTVVVHLAQRMTGFCVAQGNPKGIRSWDDLKRGDISIANRQKGSGTRILLDEHLKLLKISEKTVPGYRREFPTNLTAATVVAHGGADYSVIDEKTAAQIQKVDFIPLQKERFDIVLRKDDMNNPYVKAVIEIINSDEFKMVIEDMGGYDLSETGKITET
jgi:putative molybdopterin biosynthesis protein